MFNKTKYNFWLDATIFIAFLITAITGLLLWLVIPYEQGSQALSLLGLSRRTWVGLHDWAGLAMLIGATAHIALHWKWVTCVAGRFFGKLARQARLNFSLNSFLFVASALASLSGLVAWLVLPSGGYRGGRNLLYNSSLLDLSRYGWNDVHLMGRIGHDRRAGGAPGIASEVDSVFYPPLRPGCLLQSTGSRSVQ